MSMCDRYAVLDENRGSLDDCGVRFFVPALHLSFLNKQRGAEAGKIPLEPSHYAWALHSEAQEFILEKCPGLGVKGSDLTWNDLQTHGAGYRTLLSPSYALTGIPVLIPSSPVLLQVLDPEPRDFETVSWYSLARLELYP